MIELPVICSAETVRRIRAGEPVQVWIREGFACRQDGDLVRIRYAADGSDGPVKTVPTAEVPEWFRSETYCTHPPKHMPKALSRITLAAKLETEE